MPRRPSSSLGAALAFLSGVRLVLLALERAVYPFLPAIARGLGVSLPAAGLLLTARAVGGISAPLTVATAGRRGHHRRLMVVALGLFTAGAALVALPHRFAVAVLGFAVLGAARPAFDAGMQAYLSDRTPYARRARTLAVPELMYAGGLLVGAPAAGWLIARWDWRAPFLVAAVLAAGAMATLRGAVEPTRPHPDAPHPRLRLGRPALALLTVMGLFTFGAEVSLIVFGAWLEDGFGLSLVALGGVSTLIGLAELAGEGVTLALADRLGKRRTVVAGLVVASVAFALVPAAAGSLPAGLAAFAVALFGFEVTIVATIPIASEVDPAARSRMLAIAGVAMAAGRALAATVGPTLFARSGLGANALASVAAYALALVILPRHERGPSPTHVGG